jgi:hypothetical protein
VFNLNNEPAISYNLRNICDKNEDHKSNFFLYKIFPIGWLAYQLKSQVIYLENASGERYELSKQQNEPSKIFGEYNLFKIAKVKDPFLTDNEFFQNENVPLSETYAKIIYTDLEWDEFLWGSGSLRIKDLVVEGMFVFFDQIDILCYKTYPIKIIAHADVISLDD